MSSQNKSSLRIVNNLLTTLAKEANNNESQENNGNVANGYHHSTDNKSSQPMANGHSNGEHKNNGNETYELSKNQSLAAYERAQKALYVISEELPKNTPIVKGVDFNQSNSIDVILEGFKTSGFQASNVANAVDRIKEMIHWRLPESEYNNTDFDHLTLTEKQNLRTTIFLGFTSNQISCGSREVIRYLCEHNMIDCIVTTCGAVEEDIMKCFEPHFMGNFSLKGKDLRLKGQNRIGNLIVPTKNYCIFEQWLTPILKKMLEEQKQSFEKYYYQQSKEEQKFNEDCRLIWTPSKILRRMGKEINNTESVWYWCYKNNIPVFCPGITDGAVGDILSFLSYNDPGFILDVSRDVRLINDISLSAVMSGAIILGGGIIKHHILNSNLMRNGADWSVFINTGEEFDGSDSGAKPDEAISWGKLKINSNPVKVSGDASVMFPLVVAGTFAHPKHKKYAIKPKRKIDDCYFVKELQ